MSVLKLYDIFFILLDIYILEQELVVALSRLTNQVMYNWDGLDRVPRDSDLIIILLYGSLFKVLGDLGSKFS